MIFSSASRLLFNSASTVESRARVDSPSRSRSTSLATADAASSMARIALSSSRRSRSSMSRILPQPPPRDRNLLAIDPPLVLARDPAHSAVFRDSEATVRSPRAVGLNAEHRADEQRHRPRRPRLRAAGPRQLQRLAILSARVSREGFGQATVEVRRGFEEGFGYPVRLLEEAVATKAASDQGVVVGTDGAVVAGAGVVAAIFSGHRPHPHPLKSSSLIKRPATAGALSAGTMPLQRRCPALETRESTLRPAQSRARA